MSTFLILPCLGGAPIVASPKLYVEDHTHVQGCSSFLTGSTLTSIDRQLGHQVNVSIIQKA